MTKLHCWSILNMCCVEVSKQLNLYSTLCISSLSVKHSDMALCNKGSHSFTCHPHTKTYPPLLPSRKASPPFDWYSLRLPTKVWPGWVDLCSWSYTEIIVPHQELNPDTVTHLSTGQLALTVLEGTVERKWYQGKPKRQCINDIEQLNTTYNWRVW